MRKIFIIFGLSLIFIFSSQANAFLDMGAFIEGQEAARRANWEDRMRYQQVVNQEIDNAIRAYKLTGDYGHLCIAAYYGASNVIAFLKEQKVGCRYEQ